MKKPCDPDLYVLDVASYSLGADAQGSLHCKGTV